MTTAVKRVTKVRQRFRTSSTVDSSVQPFDESGSSASVYFEPADDRQPSWVSAVHAKFYDWLRRGEISNLTPFADAVEFVGSMRAATPEPFLSYGDDGSISVEWDRGENHLIVVFAPYGNDVFWMSDDGTEWESTLDSEAFTRINSALRKISIS